MHYVPILWLLWRLLKNTHSVEMQDKTRNKKMLHELFLYTYNHIYISLTTCKASKLFMLTCDVISMYATLFCKDISSPLIKITLPLANCQHKLLTCSQYLQV